MHHRSRIAVDAKLRRQVRWLHPPAEHEIHDRPSSTWSRCYKKWDYWVSIVVAVPGLIGHYSTTIFQLLLRSPSYSLCLQRVVSSVLGDPPERRHLGFLGSRLCGKCTVAMNMVVSAASSSSLKNFALTDIVYQFRPLVRMFRHDVLAVGILEECFARCGRFHPLLSTFIL